MILRLVCTVSALLLLVRAFEPTNEMNAAAMQTENEEEVHGDAEEESTVADVTTGLAEADEVEGEVEEDEIQSDPETTPNDSPFTEIAKELKISDSVEANSFVSGKYGGTAGRAFNERGPPGRRSSLYQVRSIIVRTGSKLNSIQFVYGLPNRKKRCSVRRGRRYGGVAGRKRRFNVDVVHGERIIGIIGRSGTSVNRIGFFTNKGRVFGPFGGTSGTPFSVAPCLLRGMFGHHGNGIHSIGFHCDRVPTPLS